MPKVNEEIAYSMPKVRDRYHCSRDVLSAWLAASVGAGLNGQPCSLYTLLETAGYKKGQVYLTPKQWSIITDHLDPYLKD